MSFPIYVPVVITAILACYIFTTIWQQDAGYARFGISWKYRSTILAVTFLNCVLFLFVVYFGLFYIINRSISKTKFPIPCYVIILFMLISAVIFYTIFKYVSRIYFDGNMERERIYRVFQLAKCKVWKLFFDYLTEEIHKNPQNILVYYYLSAVRFLTGDWKEALSVANSGLEKRHIHRFWRAMLLYNKAYSLIMQYADFEAIRVARQALRLGGSDTQFPALDTREKIAQLESGQGNRIRKAIEEGVGISIIE